MIPRDSLSTEDLVSSPVGRNLLFHTDERLEVIRGVEESNLDIRKLIAEVEFDRVWKELYTEQYREFQFLDKIWLVTKRIQNTLFSSQRSAIFGNLAQLP